MIDIAMGVVLGVLALVGGSIVLWLLFLIWTLHRDNRTKSAQSPPK